MSNKMLSLKVRLEPIPVLQFRRRRRLVIELLEEEARRQSEPLSETESQTLRADVPSQSSSHNSPVKNGGRR